MRKTLLLVIASLALSGFLPAEAKWKPKRKRRYDCTRQLQRALGRFEKGRYNEVKAILAETKMQCNGHSAMDSILYYLGSAQLRSRNPEEAKIQFERLIIDFPNSKFSEEAFFRIGHCSYAASNPAIRDQSTTRDAIRELSDFIDKYPEGAFADSARKYLNACYEKLAEKEYLNARFYEKIEKWESAIVYYRELIQAYPESKFVPESKYSIAHALSQVQRPGEAREVLEELLKQNKSPEIERKARSLLARLNQPKRKDGIKKRRLKPVPKIKTPAAESKTVQQKQQPEPAQEKPEAETPPSVDESRQVEKPAEQPAQAQDTAEPQAAPEQQAGPENEAPEENADAAQDQSESSPEAESPADKETEPATQQADENAGQEGPAPADSKEE